VLKLINKLLSFFKSNSVQELPTSVAPKIEQDIVINVAAPTKQKRVKKELSSTKKDFSTLKKIQNTKKTKK
jgi:hypothetical protein